MFGKNLSVDLRMKYWSRKKGKPLGEFRPCFVSQENKIPKDSFEALFRFRRVVAENRRSKRKAIFVSYLSFGTDWKILERLAGGLFVTVLTSSDDLWVFPTSCTAFFIRITGWVRKIDSSPNWWQIINLWSSTKRSMDNRPNRNVPSVSRFRFHCHVPQCKESIKILLSYRRELLSLR